MLLGPQISKFRIRAISFRLLNWSSSLYRVTDFCKSSTQLLCICFPNNSLFIFLAVLLWRLYSRYFLSSIDSISHRFSWSVSVYFCITCYSRSCLQVPHIFRFLYNFLFYIKTCFPVVFLLWAKPQLPTNIFVLCACNCIALSSLPFTVTCDVVMKQLQPQLFVISTSVLLLCVADSISFYSL
jgi:hypothetical protein